MYKRQLIIGENELAEGLVAARLMMGDKEQTPVALAGVVDWLRERLAA